MIRLKPGAAATGNTKGMAGAICSERLNAKLEKVLGFRPARDGLKLWLWYDRRHEATTASGSGSGSAASASTSKAMSREVVDVEAEAEADAEAEAEAEAATAKRAKVKKRAAYHNKQPAAATAERKLSASSAGGKDSTPDPKAPATLMEWLALPSASGCFMSKGYSLELPEHCVHMVRARVVV